MKKIKFLPIFILMWGCSVTTTTIDFSTAEVSGGKIYHSNSGLVIVNESEYTLEILVFSPSWGLEYCIKNFKQGGVLYLPIKDYSYSYKKVIVTAKAYGGDGGKRRLLIGVSTKEIHFSAWGYYLHPMLEKVIFFSNDFGRR